MLWSGRREAKSPVSASSFCSRQPASQRNCALKFYGVVHETALGTTGAVVIGIIGVDVAAAAAAEDAVFAGAGLEAAAAEFGVDADGDQPTEQDHDVNEDEV